MSATEGFIDELSKGLGELQFSNYLSVFLLYLPKSYVLVAAAAASMARIICWLKHATLGVNRSKTQRKFEAIEMYGSVYGSVSKNSDK